MTNEEREKLRAELQATISRLREQIATSHSLVEQSRRHLDEAQRMLHEIDADKPRG